MVLSFRRWILVVAGLAAAAAPAARGQTAAPLEVVQAFADSVAPGAVVPVEIVVRNISALPVEGIQVFDNFPTGYEVREAVPAPDRSPERLGWSVPRLGPGEQRRFRLTLQPRRDAAPGSVRNVVDVTYSARLSSVRAARVAGPDLCVDVRVPEAAPVGAPATLSLTVRNHGETAARNVALRTVLPPGLSHPEGPDLESPLGTLEPGAERIVPLPVTPTRPGTFPVRVTVQAEGGPPVVREAALVADDVRIIATAAGPTALPQHLAGLFELTVQNDGNTACPVIVWVLLPEGMDFGRASEGGGYDRQTHSVRWDLGELRPAGRRILAWNGVPRTVGEMAGRVRVATGDRVLQERAWTVRVVPGGAGSAN